MTLFPEGTFVMQLDTAGAPPLILAGATGDVAATAASEASLGPPPRRATPKRRRDWLTGRAAATAALAAYDPSARLRIRGGGWRSGQPYGEMSRDARECGLSISHCDDVALAVVADGPVGVDLERIAPRSPDFDAFAFTPSERVCLTAVTRRLELSADERTTLGWCLKEAALKLLGVGLRAALHEVEVLLPDAAPERVVARRDGHEIVFWTLRPALRRAGDGGAAPYQTVLHLAVAQSHTHFCAVVWQ